MNRSADELVDAMAFAALDRGGSVTLLAGDNEIARLATEWRAMKEDTRITAAEALYGFMGWLTSLGEPVTFSGNHDAGVAAELVAEFLKVNNLPDVREGVWPGNFVQPKTRLKSGDLREPRPTLVN